VDERFPGELETLRAENLRLRRLLKLSEDQARAADPDEPTLTGAPTAAVDMRSTPDENYRSSRLRLIEVEHPAILRKHWRVSNFDLFAGGVDVF
jgi:hypothetical protein